MSVSQSKRVRGNEVISASLIEILLVIIFVLLLIIVANSAQQPTELQRKEVCEGLKLSLKRLVGPEQVESIDCNKYKESTAEVITKITAATQKLTTDTADIWSGGGFTSDPTSVQDALDRLGEALDDIDKPSKELVKELDEAKRQVELTQARLQSALDENERVSGEVSSLAISVQNLEEQFKIARKEEARLARILSDKGIDPMTAIAGDLGGGKGRGPCLTSNPNARFPEHDYLLIIDLSPPGFFDIKLRPDEKHRDKIVALVNQGVLPTSLSQTKYLRVAESEFEEVFRGVWMHGREREDQCMYQARLFNAETQINSKVAIVEERFLKGG